VVRRKSARKLRLLLTDSREIQVLFIAPLADIVDIGIIDLDFVMDLVNGQRRVSRQRQERRGD